MDFSWETFPYQFIPFYENNTEIENIPSPYAVELHKSSRAF